MRALLQRVSRAAVTVDGTEVGAIGPGLLVFLGVARGDGETEAGRMLERILGYRVFADAEGRMNRSLRDTGGGMLIVSQFTLVAETRKGTRPGFSTAASPEVGARIYEHFVADARSQHATVATGMYGANMQVSLVNDGPVTFLLET